VIRLKLKFFNMSIINIHAKMEEKEEMVKDELYQTLERTYDKIPTNNIKIVLGDLNTKIRKEVECEPTIGKESLHNEFNHNGKRIVDFATSKHMIISSTYFPHRNIHKQTWISPDGRTANQIDHLIVGQRNASSICDIRTYRVANIDSAHHLIKVTYRERIAAQKYPRNPK